MSFITQEPVELVHFSGMRIRVIPAFDSVLMIQEMYKEDVLSDYDKIGKALDILVRNRFRLRLLSAEQKFSLLSEIYEQCINTKKRPHVGRPGPPVLDFEKDAEYIYASFMSDYGIDLIEQQGKLSWRKFIYLFQGLTDACKIKEVMRIRGMDVPKPTKYNQDRIRSILELKSYYALPAEGGGGQNGLEHLFHTLERLADS